MGKLRVTIWNEYHHEKMDEEIRKVYPEGIHMVIANYFNGLDEFEVKTATLDEDEHGLTDELLYNTDVLFWWGHRSHHMVDDMIVNRVHEKVLNGMGLVVLHSGHHSKIFKKLMGTSCNLLWREAGEKERLWVVDQSHPIAEGLGRYIELEQEEMYGESFEIPEPDELVFISWFEGGEVFRSGCCYKRGRGKIFYFRPGHESYPTYYKEEIQLVLKNAAKWASPIKVKTERLESGLNVAPIESLGSGKRIL